MPAQQPSDHLNMKDSFGWLYFAARGYATCLAVFSRHSFGPEALGMSGIGAVLCIFAAILATADPVMTRFFGLWFLAFVIQRLRSTKLYWGGARLHSLYDGWPWLAISLPGVGSEDKAKNIEPVIWFLAGVLLCAASETLGMFVMCGAGAMAVVRAIETVVYAKRVQRMRDAEIEMHAMSERYRNQ